MHRRVSKLVGYLLLSSAICSQTFGSPSGLNVIPTADILDTGVISFETESIGADNPWGEDCETFALLQYGVAKNFELGVDKCMSDPNAWLNFKWRVCEEKAARPAIAFGTQGINEEDHPQPYAVATKTFGKSRLHSGFIGIEHKTRWMLGVDHELSDKLIFQADYTNGPESSLTFGMAINFSDNLSLTVAASNGNSDDVESGHIINLAWSKTLK